MIFTQNFKNQKPSSFCGRVQNASTSSNIALTNPSKQNKAYIVQSKPQIFCSHRKLLKLAPLFNFFHFKDYGELNVNVFLKIYNTVSIWLDRLLSIHTYVYTLKCKETSWLWTIYKSLFNSATMNRYYYFDFNWLKWL